MASEIQVSLPLQGAAALAGEQGGKTQAASDAGQFGVLMQMALAALAGGQTQAAAATLPLATTEHGTGEANAAGPVEAAPPAEGGAETGGDVQEAPAEAPKASGDKSPGSLDQASVGQSACLAGAQSLFAAAAIVVQGDQTQVCVDPEQGSQPTGPVAGARTATAKPAPAAGTVPTGAYGRMVVVTGSKTPAVEVPRQAEAANGTVLIESGDGLDGKPAATVSPVGTTGDDGASEADDVAVLVKALPDPQLAPGPGSTQTAWGTAQPAPKPAHEQEVPAHGAPADDGKSGKVEGLVPEVPRSSSSAPEAVVAGKPAVIVDTAGEAEVAASRGAANADSKVEELEQARLVATDTDGRATQEKDPRQATTAEGKAPETVGPAHPAVAAHQEARSEAVQGPAAESHPGEQARLSIRDARALSETLLQESLKRLPRNVELRLDPPEMGKVTVLLSQRGQDVTVKFLAGNGEAQRMLADASSDLGKALSDKGLVLVGFAVDPQGKDQPRPGEGNEDKQGSRRYGRAVRIQQAGGIQRPVYATQSNAAFDRLA